MKKISIVLMAFMLAFSSLFFASCGDDDKKSDFITLRVNEVTHSIFYAPMYAAINNGYFEDEGIKIELVNGGGADKSMTALLSGDADIGLMGPEAAIYVNEGEADDRPVIFGQLTKRDGSFIVSKTQYANFTLDDLIDEDIIGGRKGGVPAMTLQYIIEEAGLTIGTGAGQVNLRTDVAFNLTASVFESTDTEFCTLFEPTASDFAKEKNYYITQSVGSLSGEVPYTAFMAKKSYFDDNNLTLERFLRAIYRGNQFLLNATNTEIINSLKPSFTGFSDESIQTSINNYISTDSFSVSPVMTTASFDKLQDIMINAGELDAKVSFSSVVDNTLAQNVFDYFNF